MAASEETSDFYSFLGVSKDASGIEIKRAYFKMALLCHPDKNPNDPTAKEKFQRLQSIYTTLSDATKRADYDKFGEEGVEEGMNDEQVDEDGTPKTWSVEEIEKLLQAWMKRLTPEEIRAKVERAKANMRYSPKPNGNWSSSSFIIEETKRALALGVSEIRWERFGIVSIPAEVFTLMSDQIEALVLNKNSLEILPKEISLLKNLHSLSLEENRLREFPTAILALTELRELNLSHNHIAKLPEQVSTLTNLSKLHLFSNDIEELPGCLVDMKKLAQLDVECNFIKSLPPGLIERQNNGSILLSVDGELLSQVVPAKKQKAKAKSTTAKSKATGKKRKH